MGAPQIVLIVIFAMALGMHASNHGDPYPDDYKFNFWGKLVAVGIYVTILWWGGFWV